MRELYKGGAGAGRAGIKFPWAGTFGWGGGGLEERGERKSSLIFKGNYSMPLWAKYCMWL